MTSELFRKQDPIFSRDDADRRTIAALPKNRRLVNPAFAPVWDAPAA